MSYFMQSTPSPEPKTTNVHIISVALAAIFVLLAVAQLYSYEDFPDVIASLWLPGGRPMASLVAALLVISEVAAVPFLLGMRLSPAMRVMSMLSGWLVIAAWLVIAVFINTTANAIANSGVLGATIPVTPGWWMFGIFAALGVLAAWASWGQWPRRSHTQPRTPAEN